MAQQYGTARVSDLGWGEMDRLLPAPFAPPAAHALSANDGVSHDLYWQGRTSCLREPIALIDTAGRVICTTPVFDNALRDCDGAGAALTMRAGPPSTRLTAGGASDTTGQRLCAAVASNQSALDAAIARAVRSVSPAAAAVRSPRRNGGAAVVVTLQPIPTTSRLIRSDAAAATLTLVDPLARPPAATTLWREAFDLTRSEAEVASLLVAGHTLDSAAATRGSRVTTLRVQLRHLFAKTDTSRQSDLIALLMRVV